MSAKRPATFWDRVQAEVFGWTWIVTWLAAIWYEPFRGQLFLTGAMCLVLGMIISSAVELDRKRPGPAPHPNADEGERK